MNRSEFIESLSDKLSYLNHQDVNSATHIMLDQMSSALASGERIEIRGFGSFALSYRTSKQARNPKTGELVTVPAKYVPRFKPGLELRDRVNQSRG